MLRSRRRIASCITVLWLSLSAFAAPQVRAHEIPSDVTVQIIAKPQGDRLRLLVRAPLESMQDVSFPTVGPGYLDIPGSSRKLRDAATIWLADDIEIYEDARRLPRPDLVAARVSIPSDRSFGSYDGALAHVLGAPLPETTQLIWRQALLDVLFEVPLASDRSQLALRPRLERLGLQVVTVIRFVAPDGAVRTFRVDGDQGLVALDPRWHQAALRFVRQGFVHILDGADHLLFLLCLVVPLRRNFRALVWTVSAFTVAHSVTLAASAYGLVPQALWFPPLVETLIAASILYMAVENVVATDVSSRWAVAFGFGLVHGFGFSFALRDTLQFAGDHAATSLLSFNVGVELGQLLVLVLLVPLLNFVFRRLASERLGVVVLSVIVAHVAWHWMADRYAVLREFRLRWEDFYAAVAASGLAWPAVALVAAASAWLVGRRMAARRWP